VKDNPSKHPANPAVGFGREAITIDQVWELAHGRARAALDADAGYRRALEASHASLQRQLRAGRAVYGITTGVGDSCEN